MTSNYDSWLSKQKWNNIHHSEELIMMESEANYQAYVKGVYREKSIFSWCDDNYDQINCCDCGIDVGNTLWVEEDGSFEKKVVGFWQLDEDCESVICEVCYDKIIRERD